MQKVSDNIRAADAAAGTSTTDLESILDGQIPLGISHGGGELKSLVDRVGQPSL
jgi:hypothetical protein